MNATETATTTRNINVLTRDGLANAIAIDPELQELEQQIAELKAQQAAKAAAKMATEVTVRDTVISVECAKWELQTLISAGNKLTDKVNDAIINAKDAKAWAQAKEDKAALYVNINESGECILEPEDALLYTEIAEALKSAGYGLQRQQVWATSPKPKNFKSQF